jgi:predicted O-methyltransferase YrrM
MITLQWRNIKPLGSSVPISTSITESESAELRNLAAGGDALEVGAAYGYSSVIIADVAAHLTSVDPHAWLDSYDTMRANLEIFGLISSVTILRESSNDALPRLRTTTQRFDFIFIDGDHGFEQVGRDITMAVPLLAPNGILALHDLDESSCPGVRQAVDGWRAPNYVVDTLAVYTDLNEA